MIIDTHTHIYSKEFDNDREVVIQEAKKEGIEAILLPNIDVESITPMLNLVEEEPQFAFPMMGLHPTEVNSDYSTQLSIIESYLSKREYYGIGEIGIDLYWDKTYLKEQKFVFEEQLRWSIDCNLPVSIHTRNAFEEVFDSIHKIGVDKLQGVFHCFTGNYDDLAEIKKMENFMIGIGGVITYPKSDLCEVIKDFDLKRIVLETDAPYLPPTPYRGKRNEPKYLWEVAKRIAASFTISAEDVAKQTRNNARALFFKNSI